MADGSDDLVSSQQHQQRK